MVEPEFWNKGLDERYLGTLKKSPQNYNKKQRKFLWKWQKSWQKHSIKLWAQNHYKVYKTQHLALTTITTCSAKISFVKFCRCKASQYISTTTSWSYIEPVSNKA